MFMGALKPWHVIVVLVIVLLLFGARRLPDLARSVGQSLRIFKEEVKELTSDGKNEQPPSAGASAGVTPGGVTDPVAPPVVPGLLDSNAHRV